MRKLFWIAILALTVIPTAHADLTTYVITFDGPGAPTIVGSDIVTYDTTLEEFTTPTIEINWDGSDTNGGPISLNLNPGPNPLITDPFDWNCDTKFGANSRYLCGIEDPSSPDGTNIYSGGIQATNELNPPQDGGFNSVTFTPTPEIPTAILWLTGILVLILLQRRRFSILN